MTREIPLVDEGEADPGQQAPGGAWEGPLAWSRWRGETLVTFFRGIARRAAPVLGPDDAPTTAARVLDELKADAPESTAWGLVSTLNDGAAGSLVFAADGPARFVRSSDPGSQGTCDFELALAASIELAVAAGDVDFARALYAALGNLTWHGPDGSRFGSTLRGAGGVVAAFRGCGEGYIDFYCSATEGVVRADVRRALAAIGWRPRTTADHAADAVQLKALVAQWVARPVGHVAPWFECSETASAPRAIVDPHAVSVIPPKESGMALFWWLAKTARVSPEEYGQAWALDDDLCLAEDG